VRLLDVFVLGPFMVWAGLQQKDPLLLAGLVSIGIGTIWYNGRNYLRLKASERGQV
jgi:hypothetical protein